MLVRSECLASGSAVLPSLDSSLIIRLRISFSMVCKVAVLASDLESSITPKRLFIWIANLMAMIEVRPAKPSNVVTPKSRLLMMAAIILCSSCSSTFIGTFSCTASLAACFSGLGNAFLSTFMFWFRGIFSICMVTAGTIYGGFSSRIKRLSA